MAGIVKRPWFALGFWVIFLAGTGIVVTRIYQTVVVPGVFLGQVWDEIGPVAGARVRFKGHKDFALSDAKGNFLLPYRREESAQVTVAKENYFITGAPASPRLALQLKKLPTEDFEDYCWVDPFPNREKKQNCGNCHGTIFQEWSESRHSRSAANRHLFNLYEGTDWHGNPGKGWNLLTDNPAGAGVCNACHAPTASFEEDLRRLGEVANRGIHCDYCHKIAEAPLENVGLSHGRYAVKLLRPEYGQLFFGPLDDVDRNEDSYSSLYTESKYCASCHEGVVFGVHVYSTYSEWLQSPAKREGKQCQTCHMAPTGELKNLAPGKGGINRDPWTLAAHRFPGGAEMLRRCLQVSVEAERDSQEVRVRLEIRAEGVGHRVPTGFVDRNLILVVEAQDSHGKKLKNHSGPKVPEMAGEMAGLPGKVFAKQLYDFAGRGPVPFWRADPDFLDTRLWPGRPDRTDFSFPATADRLQIRLIYHRFWPSVAQEKAWPDNDMVLIDRVVNIGSEKIRCSMCPTKD
ncbi:MAG TPA: cytochrome c3 family protein [Gemmataceae bacterium]|nr:cytochrome c3 family protein [Gemmataceae bacterium]